MEKKNVNIAKMANDLGISEEKIRKILFPNVYVFSSLEEASNAYHRASKGTEEEAQAFLKLASFYEE